MQLSGHDATMSDPSTQIPTSPKESRFLFLGTSTSVGVPVIGCQCETCTSDFPWDNRTRSSALLEGPWGSLLIDSGPDLREQALREKISKVDAVLYTHEHVDHVAGFDELRAFCWRRDEPLPLFASAETLAGLERMYPWAFASGEQQRGYIRPKGCPITGPFQFEGLNITPIEVLHGQVRTFGYRFDHKLLGSLAYIPDVKSIPAASLELMHNLDVLVIDGLRHAEHSTHMSVEEALKIIAQTNPIHSYLTHLSHELGWEKTNASLPRHVSLAHDGLSLSFPDK
jgi:phosphoribosyl 1,2-cyclic phosphate phosphodiesterase